jgi:hypothetical protein
MGFRPVREAIQVDSMDDALRNALWNGMFLAYFERGPDLSGSPVRRDDPMYDVVTSLWMHVMGRPIDNLPYLWIQVQESVKEYFFECPWYAVYDTIEFLAERGPDAENNGGFMSWCNAMLTRERSAYRFASNKLARITSDEEIVAIEGALKAASPVQPVRDHLQHALSLLSDRKTPDYRNSIKESISAVEAVCKLLPGRPVPTSVRR